MLISPFRPHSTVGSDHKNIHPTKAEQIDSSPRRNIRQTLHAGVRSLGQRFARILDALTPRWKAKESLGECVNRFKEGLDYLGNLKELTTRDVKWLENIYTDALDAAQRNVDRSSSANAPEARIVKELDSIFDQLPEATRQNLILAYGSVIKAEWTPCFRTTLDGSKLGLAWATREKSDKSTADSVPQPPSTKRTAAGDVNASRPKQARYLAGGSREETQHIANSSPPAKPANSRDEAKQEAKQMAEEFLRTVQSGNLRKIQYVFPKLQWVADKVLGPATSPKDRLELIKAQVVTCLATLNFKQLEDLKAASLDAARSSRAVELSRVLDFTIGEAQKQMFTAFQAQPKRDVGELVGILSLQEAWTNEHLERTLAVLTQVNADGRLDELWTHLKNELATQSDEQCQTIYKNTELQVRAVKHNWRGVTIEPSQRELELRLLDELQSRVAEPVVNKLLDALERPAPTSLLEAEYIEPILVALRPLERANPSGASLLSPTVLAHLKDRVEKMPGPQREQLMENIRITAMTVMLDTPAESGDARAPVLIAMLKQIQAYSPPASEAAPLGSDSKA